MGFSLLIWFDCSLLLFLSIPCLPIVCENAEVRILMEMKSALDPQNKILVSWTNGSGPCGGAFEGVACNEHRKVANISLQGKGLYGEVPAAVAGLKCLSGLYLHYNYLTGEIPKEISQLTELVDLYLDFNNLSGTIPPEIGTMPSLQVLDLCNNQLSGGIPTGIGSMERLSVLALQYNRLSGAIPASLGNLGTLKRLNLSFNYLIGAIPATLAAISELEVLDVQNNTLSGIVPPGLKRLNEGFQYENNMGLCSVEFSSLRNCSSWDNPSINTQGKVLPEPAIVHLHCNQTQCSTSSKFPRVAIVVVTITSVIALLAVGLVILIRYRRRKQKISSASDTSASPAERTKECYYKRSSSPLVSLEYSDGWDGSHEFLKNFRFNLEELESATQYFSEANLMQRTKFSSVYKGMLRDGSVVAIRSLSVSSCKSEEGEFAEGLNLLTSLRHENLVQLRGFCCSRGRGECFLIYDFAPNGNLSKYLDVEDGSPCILDWSTRVSIINSIAKGIAYLHSSQPNKPAIIHQNISTDKVLIDDHFNPLISDSGLPKLLADDVVFSALKASAAMGYLAPEYITTGRFTEKSDVYAFGVIILQLLSGTQLLSTSTRVAAESCEFVGFIDAKLHGIFSESEAATLAKTAMVCTRELPDERPTMEVVIQELSRCHSNNP